MKLSKIFEEKPESWGFRARLYPSKANSSLPKGLVFDIMIVYKWRYCNEGYL